MDPEGQVIALRRALLRVIPALRLVGLRHEAQVVVLDPLVHHQLTEPDCPLTGPDRALPMPQVAQDRPQTEPEVVEEHRVPTPFLILREALEDLAS